MICILIGPPCAGKTLLIDGLTAKLALPHVSAPELLQGLGRGEEGCSKESIDAAHVEKVMDRLREADCAQGAILDNFPQNMKQAKALEDALRKHFGAGVAQVLTKRCNCAGREVTAERLQRWAKNTGALRNFYGAERCTELDGSRPSEEVLAQAVSALEASNSHKRAAKAVDKLPCLLQKGPAQKEAAAGGFHGPADTKASQVPLDAEPNPVEAVDKVAVIYSHLQRVEGRLSMAETQLKSFSVDDSCKWYDHVDVQPCGCKVRTKTYVGAEPPALASCGASDQELEQIFGECQQLMWEIRAADKRRQDMDPTSWLAALFPVACCSTSDPLMRVQTRFNAVHCRAAEVRSLHKAVGEKTASQVATTYCAEHKASAAADAGTAGDEDEEEDSGELGPPVEKVWSV